MTTPIEDQVLDGALIKQQGMRTAHYQVAIPPALASAISDEGGQQRIALFGCAGKDVR